MQFGFIKIMLIYRLAAKTTELSSLTKDIENRNKELKTLKEELEKQKKKNNVSKPNH